MDLATIQLISISRSNRWMDGTGEWSALEWAGAMAGEAGETCNAAKKLKRLLAGMKNINKEEGRDLHDVALANHKIASEAADTLLYAVLVAAKAGYVGDSFMAIVADVFNTKSEEYGFPERLVG